VDYWSGEVVVGARHAEGQGDGQHVQQVRLQAALPGGTPPAPGVGVAVLVGVLVIVGVSVAVLVGVLVIVGVSRSAVSVGVVMVGYRWRSACWSPGQAPGEIVDGENL